MTDLEELAGEREPQEVVGQLIPWIRTGDPPAADSPDLMLVLAAGELALEGASELPPNPADITSPRLRRAVARAEERAHAAVCGLGNEDREPDPLPRKWREFARQVAALRARHPIPKPPPIDPAVLDTLDFTFC